MRAVARLVRICWPDFLYGMAVATANQIIILKIWHSTSPLFCEAEKWINYSTNMKGRFGKISRIFWGTTLGPKIVLAEPKTPFYNSDLMEEFMATTSETLESIEP